MHLPSSAPGWQVPLAEASRQMLRTLPFSLVGFGELSEVVEKDDHKDVLLSAQSSGPVYCVTWVGRVVTSGLCKEAHVSPWSRRRQLWARALLAHDTCITAVGHRDSRGHCMFLQPKGCIQLALVGQQTSARTPAAFSLRLVRSNDQLRSK